MNFFEKKMFAKNCGKLSTFKTIKNVKKNLLKYLVA